MQSRPRMRPVEAFPVRQGEDTLVGLRDRSGLVPEVLVISPQVLAVVMLLDGETPLSAVVHAFAEKYGVILSEGELCELVESLDAYLFLDSPHFHAWLRKSREEYLRLPARPSSCAGSAYPSEPKALAAQLEAMLGRDGAPEAAFAPPRGMVVPHLDFGRGAPAYAAGFRALRAAGPAETYVILGTNHFGGDRFYTATRMAYETPLGTVGVDEARLARIVAAYGDDLLADEYDHAREHSVELAVALLTHLFGAERFRIVPMLCGGFERLQRDGLTPAEVPSVRAMTEALAELAAEAPGRVCLLAAADLSHFGRHFGDEEALSRAWTRRVEARDREILAEAEAGRPADFFARLYADGNANRICSAAGIYTVLAALQRPARLLHYHQAVDERMQCAVTCAALWIE